MSESWEISDDVEETHVLLCACDAYIATEKNPAPVRNPEATRKLVNSGCVHVLRNESNEAIAMITLTWEAPFDEQRVNFPDVQKPIYMRRLAVHPNSLMNDTLVGVKCLRKAIELATENGADAIRSETNPNNPRVYKLLLLLGFREYGRMQSEDAGHRVFLQKLLRTERI